MADDLGTTSAIIRTTFRRSMRNIDHATLKEGIEALREAEAFLPAFGHSVDKARVGRLVDDIKGLIGRLDDTNAEDWSLGAARAVLSPLDVTVIANTERLLSARSPYADDGRSAKLRALWNMLAAYLR